MICPPSTHRPATATTAAHGVDGYKAHVAIDPDAEVITAAEEVSPATSGDAVVATLLGDLTADGQGSGQAARVVVYGDSAWHRRAPGLARAAGCTPMVEDAAAPTAPGGRFAKDQFRLDLQAGTVTCPARVTVAIRPARRGGGQAAAPPAASARCATPAPAASAGGWSPSTPTRPPSPPLRPPA